MNRHFIAGGSLFWWFWCQSFHFFVLFYTTELIDCCSWQTTQKLLSLAWVLDDVANGGSLFGGSAAYLFIFFNFILRNRIGDCCSWQTMQKFLSLAWVLGDVAKDCKI
jgi:hypothetical protein